MPAQLPDPRIRRSRSALEGALRDLIAERELHQISVSDLTKRAGVDRSTFYEHYADVDDLAACACTAVFDELVSAASGPTGRRARGEQPSVGLTAFFGHVAQHAPLYRALLGERGSARVVNHLLQRFATAVHSARDDGGGAGSEGEVKDGGAGSATEVADPFAVFVAGALLGTIIDWLRRGCPGTPEQMSAAIWPHLHASASADITA